MLLPKSCQNTTDTLKARSLSKRCLLATLAVLSMLVSQASSPRSALAQVPPPTNPGSTPPVDPNQPAQTPPAPVTPPPKPDALQGVELFNNKDYAGAIVHFDKVLKLHPKNQTVHYYKALSLQYLNDPVAAKKEYQLALDGKDAQVAERAKSAIAGMTRKKAAAPAAPSNDAAPLKPATSKEPEALKPAAVAAAKPRVIFFFVESDVPSRDLIPTYSDLARNYQKQVDFQRLNADDMSNRKLVDKYEINDYPTFIFVDNDGKEKERMVGIPEEEQPREALASRIKKLIK